MRPRHGWPSVNGFEASLRLLIEDEGYSLQDVGLMFGVSRERVRQWCGTYDVLYDYGRGMQSVRLWDDREHRFRPIKRRVFHRLMAAVGRSERRLAADQARAERQATIVERVQRLRANLGREPSFREMWCACTGRPVDRTGQYMVRMLGLWDSRATSMRVKREQFRAATGTVARPRGGRGHTGPRAPRRDRGVKRGPRHRHPVAGET